MWATGADDGFLPRRPPTATFASASPPRRAGRVQQCTTTLPFYEAVKGVDPSAAVVLGGAPFGLPAAGPESPLTTSTSSFGFTPAARRLLDGAGCRWPGGVEWPKWSNR